MKRRELIVYYGAFITDRIRHVRELPVLNHAASKRMLRVAQGLTTADRKCVIVSSGLAPRIKSTWKKLITRIEHVDGIPVLTVAQFGVKFLGYFLTPITAVSAAISLNRKRKLAVVVQYNYYPDAFFFSLWCKLIYRSKVILDLEDVAVPRFSDWKRDSESRPVVEIWSWIFMKMSIWMADLVFSPSRKLGVVVPAHKFTVVSGCQKVAESISRRTGAEEINVLLSGGIKFENGLDVFAEALNVADEFVPNVKLNVIVCGPGKYEWLKERLKPLRFINLKTLGFLSNSEFEKIYSNIDVCLALQNPTGRYSSFKAPSKGYEALCSGKALIVGDVGDFDQLPDSVCFHLRPYSGRRLGEILAGLTTEYVESIRQNALEYSKLNFDSSIVGRKLIERVLLKQK